MYIKKNRQKDKNYKEIIVTNYKNAFVFSLFSIFERSARAHEDRRLNRKLFQVHITRYVHMRSSLTHTFSFWIANVHLLVVFGSLVRLSIVYVVSNEIEHLIRALA